MIILLLKYTSNSRIFLPNELKSGSLGIIPRYGLIRADREMSAYKDAELPAVKHTLGGKVHIRKSPSISRAPNHLRFNAKGPAWPPVFFEKSQGEPIQERFA